MLAQDITDTPSIDAIRSAALKRYTSVLSLPLKRDGKILGALTIYADDLGKFNERIIAAAGMVRSLCT